MQKFFILFVILTWPLQASYVYEGEVIKGKQEARQLGFPTANIAVEAKHEHGVYACTVTYDGSDYQGMGYSDKSRPKMFEAHMFGFQQEIYGQIIRVKLDKFIRGPKPFTTFEAFKDVLANDAKDCLAYYSK